MTWPRSTQRARKIYRPRAPDRRPPRRSSCLFRALTVHAVLGEASDLAGPDALGRPRHDAVRRAVLEGLAGGTPRRDRRCSGNAADPRDHGRWRSRICHAGRRWHRPHRAERRQRRPIRRNGRRGGGAAPDAPGLCPTARIRRLRIRPGLRRRRPLHALRGAPLRSVIDDRERETLAALRMCRGA